jgi:hypothetical protein
MARAWGQYQKQDGPEPQFVRPRRTVLIDLSSRRSDHGRCTSLRENARYRQEKVSEQATRRDIRFRAKVHWGSHKRGRGSRVASEHEILSVISIAGRLPELPKRRDAFQNRHFGSAETSHEFRTRGGPRTRSRAQEV